MLSCACYLELMICGFANANPLLAIGYRALDDEFAEGPFDLESAVTAVAVRIEDENEARWIANCR